jgi:hypothetical protein
VQMKVLAVIGAIFVSLVVIMAAAASTGVMR